MSVGDILVLIACGVLVLISIFAIFIYPKITGQKSSCTSCPVSKKGKRLIKDYHKTK